jgi:CRISPR/Cas system-associated exonuclease Cas4 (RecB family)
MTTNTRPDAGALVQSLLDTVGGSTFETWYDERRFTENIRAGKPWLNTPPPVKPPKQHSPSQLYQCHRKIYYRQLNAPEETEDPEGIFWTGSKFEEEVVMPYLESIVDDRAYVRNSMWVDYEVETSAGDVQIRGSTDPVIVDEESTPLLPTEVKTKDSIENTTEPNDHHLAQLYAYMEGLSREWETEVRDGLIIYGDRTDLSIKSFHVRFDRKRWGELVHDWAGTHTEYRLDEELPPADPVFGWECNFCSFRHRCGESRETDFEDVAPTGLLPGIRYPREKLETYLQSHSGAKLIPSSAVQYPDLIDRYGVHEWRCEAGSHTFRFDAVEWNGKTNEYPACPTCVSNGIPAQLTEPVPSEQTSESSAKSEPQ